MQVAIEGNDECELGESENDSLETMTEDSTAETHSTKRPLKSQSDKKYKKTKKGISGGRANEKSNILY